MGFIRQQVYTISSINRLSAGEKREIYARLIPSEILELFQMDLKSLYEKNSKLLKLSAPSGSSVVEMELRHQPDFRDPVLYGHMMDTLNGQVHVLLYVLNDPSSPRFDVDRLPSGQPTKFGTQSRNLEAEQAALEFGLAPGQVRRGLRLMGSAIEAFERFIVSLGQDIFFTEPLYYHNAVLFEKHGFAYEKGRRLMERIQKGFSQGGDLIRRLDKSTPFRSPQATNSIRLRSWAIHDNLLGEPFTNVTMYKRVGKFADINTCFDCIW